MREPVRLCRWPGMTWTVACKEKAGPRRRNLEGEYIRSLGGSEIVEDTSLGFEPRRVHRRAHRIGDYRRLDDLHLGAAPLPRIQKLRLG